MDDQSQLTPPAPEPASEPTGASAPSTPSAPAAPVTLSWWSQWHRLVIAGAGAIVVLAVAAAAFLLVLKPAPSIERMVPATVDVYGFVNLDPSMSQKVNLLQAVHRFPDTSTDQKISDLLDKGFKNSGFTYSHDVQPWLGSGLGMAVKAPAGGTSADATYAVYAVSKDDARAQAFLTNLRNGKYTIKSRPKVVFTTPGASPLSPRDYTWQDRSYDGITISIGTPKAGGSPAGAYAIVDHVVVVASSEAFMHEIIDTAHGRAARLVDSAQYKATLAKLPSDRLAVGYISGSITASIKDQLRTPLAGQLGGLNNLHDLNAFQGAAVVISARSNGVIADVAVRVDGSKLSPATRQALTSAGHPDKVIGWIPASTDAFLAFGNLRQAIQSALDQLGTEPSVQQSTDMIGLTGPHGLMPHLTGDFAIAFEVSRSFVPAGAIMIGTDNAAAMRSFFAGILTLATTSSPGVPAPTTSTYLGVKITTLSAPSFGASNLFAPSYAVVDGMGIVASNPAELKAVIDAHKYHAGIDADAAYAAASRASLSNPSSVFYVAIGQLASTLKSAPVGSPVGGLDFRGSDNLNPLNALIITSSSSPDGFLERFILVIK